MFVVLVCCYGSEVITIDDDVIDVDTCDSQTSESTATTASTTSLDWNPAPSAAATRGLCYSGTRFLADHTTACNLLYVLQ